MSQGLLKDVNSCL